jgi:hypothetical protein
LIGEQGARLLRDQQTGETPKGAKREEAHRTPRGKRASWSGNQHLLIATSLRKQLLKKNKTNFQVKMYQKSHIVHSWCD